MAKIKKIVYSLTLIPLVIILLLFGWLFTIVFEGEKPAVTLQPLPPYLSKAQAFTLNIQDRKRGLKTLKVSITQEGREIGVLEKKFPFQGFMNRNGIHRDRCGFSSLEWRCRLRRLCVGNWDKQHRHRALRDGGLQQFSRLRKWRDGNTS